MNAKAKSPFFPATVALAIAGALLPVVSLVRGGGPSGSMNDAGMLVVLWGVSPFVLPLLAARFARRAWVQKMVLVLVGIAALAGVIGHLVLMRRMTGADATMLFFVVPLWQWPMAVLGCVLALFVPSVEGEKRMAAPVPETPAADA